MLVDQIGDKLQLGLAQAVLTVLLVLGVVLVARRRAIRLERETVSALVRGFIQIVAVGSILVIVFRGPSWIGAVVLLLMTLAAAATAARRASGVPGAFGIAFYGIATGAGVVIALMTLLGAIDPRLASLIPVGSMVIASAMNSNALALERFRAEIGAHVGHIEAGLALGVAPATVVAPYVEAAVRAALIPRIDTLRALGIVWIPGLMAGMLLAGSDPVYAAIYQFVVVGMIFAAAGLASLVSALLIRGRAFSKADQLVLGVPR